MGEKGVNMDKKKTVMKGEIEGNIKINQIIYLFFRFFFLNRLFF